MDKYLAYVGCILLLCCSLINSSFANNKIQEIPVLNNSSNSSSAFAELNHHIKNLFSPTDIMVLTTTVVAKNVNSEIIQNTIGSSTPTTISSHNDILNTERLLLIISFIFLMISLMYIYKNKRQIRNQRQSITQLKQIITEVPVGIVMTNSRGEIILANSQAEKELGKNGESIMGHKAFEFYVRDNQRLHILKKLTEDGELKKYAVIYRSLAGELIESIISVKVMMFNNEVGNLGFFVNLSERVKIEQELLKLRKDSEKANEFKMEFLSNMGAKMKPPIQVINSSLQNLPLNKDEKQQQNMVDKVKQSAGQLENMIDELLYFSTIEAKNLGLNSTVFLLDDVLKDVYFQQNLKTKNNDRKIIFNTDPKIPYQLIGDHQRLQQVLNALIMTVNKHIIKGVIVVACHLIDSDRERVNLKFVVTYNDNSGKSTKLERDEVNENILEEYSQIKSQSSAKTTNIDLSLRFSRNFIKLLGGELQLEKNTYGFCEFSFPITLEQPENIDQQHFKLPPILANKNVLLICHDDYERNILKTWLSYFSLNVTAVSNILHANELLVENNQSSQAVSGQYSLLFLNQENFDNRIHKVASRLFDNHDLALSPKMVLLNSYGEESVENTLYDFSVAKPLTISALFKAVNNVLQVKESINQIEEVKHQFSGKVLLIEHVAKPQHLLESQLVNSGVVIEKAHDSENALNHIKKTIFDMVFISSKISSSGLDLILDIREYYSDNALPIVLLLEPDESINKQFYLEKGVSSILVHPINLNQVQQILKQYLLTDNASGDAEVKLADQQILQLKNIIDVDLALTYVDGNKKLLFELLISFYYRYKNYQQDIKTFDDANKKNERYRFFHSLQGMSENIGTIELQKIAKKIVVALKLSTNTKYHNLLPVFEGEMSRIINALDLFLGECSDDKLMLSKNIITDVNEVEFEKKLKQSYRCIKEGDLSGLPIIESLLSSSEKLKMLSGDLLVTLKSQIDDYSFVEAKETIEQIASLVEVKLE